MPKPLIFHKSIIFDIKCMIFCITDMIFGKEKKEKKKAITFTTTRGSNFTSITEKNIQKNVLKKQTNKRDENTHDTTKDEVKK